MEILLVPRAVQVRHMLPHEADEVVLVEKQQRREERIAILIEIRILLDVVIAHVWKAIVFVPGTLERKKIKIKGILGA